MDFFRACGDCAFSLARERAKYVAAVPRLGLSLDTADFFAGCDRAHGEFVDRPAGTLFARFGCDSRRCSFFLPVAQSLWRIRFSPRARLIWCKRETLAQVIAQIVTAN